MITQIQLLRNIGPFDSVTGSNQTRLARLTLVYAENGRGKTMLSAVFRSLATASPDPITERRRLGAQHGPHVVIELEGAARPALFQNNAWNDPSPNVLVFDDIFVNENVYSGLEVMPEHRQNLHQLIVGRQGVALANEMEGLTREIARHQAVITEKAVAIPPNVRGPMSVDEFCVLPLLDNVDATIEDTRRRLAAFQQGDAVTRTPAFEGVELPSIDAAQIQALLQRDLPQLDSQAANAVQAHFQRLGRGAEEWAVAGTRYAAVLRDAGADSCPFCDQPLGPSVLVNHYRGYFSQAYTEHKRAIDAQIASVERLLGGDALVRFQQAAGVQSERSRFWSQFVQIPQLSIDTRSVIEVWQRVRDSILEALRRKQLAPLEQFALDDDMAHKLREFETTRQQCQEVSRQLIGTNDSIQRVKAAVGTGNIAATQSEVARLTAAKTRYSDPWKGLCDEYLSAKAAKKSGEDKKEAVRTALDQHRAAVFPRYQNLINDYLGKFNAGFRIVEVQAVNPRGIPSSNYQIEINNVRVPLTQADAGQPTPAFKSTLSAGDRCTLALAFFFASLDQEPNLGNSIVIIDDPVSSLDEGRTLTTAQEIRTLSQRAKQVILLSHSKPVLCMVWQHADRSVCASLQVARCSTGSTIEAWNISDAAVTEYDRRHALLRAYAQGTERDGRQVAQCLRLVLEGYLRVARTGDFRPGTRLGDFVNQARQRLTTNQPILSAQDLTELEHINEYAKLFHHDTNHHGWQVEVNNINDQQLSGFVGRVLRFTSR